MHVVIVLSSFNVLRAQSPDISAMSNFKVNNRHISIDISGGKDVVHLDAANGAGVAWINNTNFSTGTVQFDVKGKDVMQQSFVGIALHGVNDSSFDVIYFRPFNFNAADLKRKDHSVQYISMPQYDWSYLREKFPNKYESSLSKAIDGNSWFHAKIVVDARSVEVFVNGDDKPSLTVKPLNDFSSGKIGFWVGNGSDGDFSNLIIKKN